VAYAYHSASIQTELMMRRIQFIRRTKEAVTYAACAGNTRDDIILSMGIHGSITASITGKTMSRILCFDYITNATIPLPNL